MSKRLFIYSSLFGIVLLSIAVITYLKPDVSKTSLESSVNTAPMMDHLPTASTQQPLTVPKDQHVVVSEADLIAQRDALYVTFGQISMDMMEGQKPDLRQVSQMLEQHQNLVKKGIILRDDAKTYLEFLHKVFPEMQSELNFYLEEIERMKT